MARSYRPDRSIWTGNHHERDFSFMNATDCDEELGRTMPSVCLRFRLTIWCRLPSRRFYVDMFSYFSYQSSTCLSHLLYGVNYQLHHRMSVSFYPDFFYEFPRLIATESVLWIQHFQPNRSVSVANNIFSSCIFFSQSLGILASIPAAILIVCLVGLLLYLLTRCCDRKSRKAKSQACQKFTLISTTLFCCVAIGLGECKTELLIRTHTMSHIIISWLSFIK